MATSPRNLKASRTLTNVKQYESTSQTPELIAPHGLGTGIIQYLPQLLPLTYDVGLNPDAWRPWQDGQQIDGFLVGEDGMSVSDSGVCKRLHDTEVIAVVCKGGTIPYTQIPLHVTGATDAALKTALRDGMRARGFNITNLDGVH
jgi:hypothetical protein